MICFYWEYLLPAIRMHTQRQRNVQGFGDLVHRVRQLTERGIMQTSAELGLCEREVAKSKVWDLQPSFCTQESRALCSKPPEELSPRPWLLHWELLGWDYGRTSAGQSRFGASFACLPKSNECPACYQGDLQLFAGCTLRTGRLVK